MVVCKNCVCTGVPFAGQAPCGIKRHTGKSKIHWKKLFLVPVLVGT